jgi:hypothetical protein
LGDKHNFVVAQEQLQQQILNELLEYVSKIPAEELSKINFLFECSPMHIEAIRAFEKNYNQPYPTPGLLSYISTLYANNKIPISIHSLACDIATPVDLFIYQLGVSFFGDLLGIGNFNSYKENIKETEKFITVGNLERLKLSPKSSLYAEIKNNSENIISDVLKKPVTLTDYLERLNQLETQVKNAVNELPLEYKRANLPFLIATLRAKNVVARYNLPSNANIASLLVRINNFTDNETIAAIEYFKLFNPSTYARDVIMLAGLINSQKKADVTIFYAGLKHIIDLEEALKKEYKTVASFDLIVNVKSFPNGGMEVTLANQEGLWDTLNKIAHAVPLLKRIVDTHKK